MHRYLFPAIAAAALIAITTVPQWIWSRYLGAPPITEQQKLFAERMKDIPTTVGDWESKEVPVDLLQMAAARADGFYSRRFFNRQDPRQVVEVLVVSGNGRDIIAHTPDQCFVLTGGFDQEDRETYVIDTGRTTADFSTSKFHRGISSVEGPQTIRCFWSFSTDGKWVAPAGTLQKFLSNSPALYKVYAVTDVPFDSGGRPDDSPALPFLRQFMPLLNATLFPADAPKTADAASTSGADSQPAKAAAADSSSAK